MPADSALLTPTRDDSVALVSGARTAIGKYDGSLRDFEASDLGAACIAEALTRAQLDVDSVDEVVMGQVGQVGADAYNARRCALKAGLPASTTAMNVNRLCASGLQAIIAGAQELLLGQADVVVAGGNESMTRQPFLDYGAKNGTRLGDRTLIDGTLSLITDPFGGYAMGCTAERVATKFGITREDQDLFALASQERALKAIAAGAFADEVVPVQLGGGAIFSDDEHPRPTTRESLAKLKPAFAEGGSVTAGNSSGINDGAAAVVLMRRSEAERRGLAPRLTLRSWAVTGIAPEIMGYAPADAIPKALARAELALGAIDVIELNEAFAAQVIAVARALDIDQERLNPHGGAIALGHPVGATGAILTVKLMHALERLDARLGMVAMCVGGGQGIAAVFERPSS